MHKDQVIKGNSNEAMFTSPTPITGQIKLTNQKQTKNTITGPKCHIR